MVVKAPGREKESWLRRSLQGSEELERVLGELRKVDLVSDPLTAHAYLNNLVRLLQVGAERHYVNLGLFSNHFLRERMQNFLSQRGRKVNEEVSLFLSKLGGEVPTEYSDSGKVLAALGYSISPLKKEIIQQFNLISSSNNFNVTCLVAANSSLDTKEDSAQIVPSYQAVSALQDSRWVILTNGRLWRLYSSRVNSPSTNYFEIDLEDVSDSSDPRLNYFVSMFSAASLFPKTDGSDLDGIFDGSLKYANEVETHLREKVFDGQLFLNLIRAILSHRDNKKYSEEDLKTAKSIALKLLYRILFLLYAESRGLLPMGNSKYIEISLGSLRQQLAEFDNSPKEDTLWKHLHRLFKAVQTGRPDAGLPEYDGELFRDVEELDSLDIGNRYLALALRELTEYQGKGIDYQNLGVRHLGSLYEALLEYDVRQAKENLIIYKNGALDAEYAADLKAKPKPFVEKGELFLTTKGLARKGTGSYYTPDDVVRYLAKEGLRPILDSRKKSFEEHQHQLNRKRGKDPELEKQVLDDLLGVKVVDPAMGSGHFLVAVVDEITNWVIERLKEHPESPLSLVIDEFKNQIVNHQSTRGVSLDLKLLTDTIVLKRMIMKQCVYGVDINPLAVELAKLSLWLDSFTIGTPLTFLDHHIRCGDALMGYRLSEVGNRAGQDTLDAWHESIGGTGLDLTKKVSMPADLTKDEIDLSRRFYNQARKAMEPYKVAMDVACACILDENVNKGAPRNLPLIAQVVREGRLEKQQWYDSVRKAVAVAADYQAFHWEVEFPDALAPDGLQFDLVIMNPPWDTLKPKDDDYFSLYDPHFRRIKDKVAKKKLMTKLLSSAEAKKDYENYRHRIETKVRFYKDSGQFTKRGTGDTNSWKLFLEKALTLATSDGVLSVVMPSGIVTDEGAKPLREALFQGHIRALYEFENTKGIFPDVHRSYKFVLLVANRTGNSEVIPSAFYLHDIAAITGDAEKEKFVEVPMSLIKRSAPESLSIPEVRSKAALSVFSRIYDVHPLLGDAEKGWSVSLITELHRTNHARLFRKDGKGWKLIEGKNFQQFILDYEPTEYTILPEEGLQTTEKRKEYTDINKKIHSLPRLAFRDTASSTNVRGMIACILPPKTFSPNTAVFVHPLIHESFPNEQEYLRMILYLSGILNSMPFDFLIRSRITMHLNFFYVYQTPVPALIRGKVVDRIVGLSARLTATSGGFDQIAEFSGSQIKPLSMKERIELLAELNAIVSIHYGISKVELR